jgi:hypothetical protein
VPTFTCGFVRWNFALAIFSRVLVGWILRAISDSAINDRHGGWPGATRRAYLGLRDTRG